MINTYSRLLCICFMVLCIAIMTNIIADGGVMHEALLIRDVVAGYQHSFYITSDHSLWAFGSNAHGQLGIGSNGNFVRSPSGAGGVFDSSADIDVPTKVTDGVVKVAAGKTHTLIVKLDGSLWACGSGSVGQLGDGRVNVRWAEGAEWCTDENGNLYDTSYYIDNNIICLANRPIKIMDNVVDAACGTDFSIALTNDGGVWFWGLGLMDDNGNMGRISTPKQIVSSGICAVNAGNNKIFLLRDDGTLWEGSIFSSYNDEQTNPVSNILQFIAVPTLHSVRSVSSSACTDSLMVILNDNSLWAWGYDEMSGLLGKGANDDPVIPMHILDNIESVSMSESQIYALSPSGELYVIGYDILHDRLENTFATCCENILDVALGHEYVLLLQEDGVLMRYSYGQELCIEVAESKENVVGISDNHDVSSASPWAQEAIKIAWGDGLIPTELQANFSSIITREDFCQLIVQYLEVILESDIQGILKHQGTTGHMYHPFEDTQSEYVSAVYALDIVHGISDHKFDPLNGLTREQAATIFLNMSYFLGDAPSQEQRLDFQDGSEISSWALPGVSYVVSQKIMNGTGNNCFDPQGRYTLEQAIISFQRALY